jgi:hypothetical protein
MGHFLQKCVIAEAAVILTNVRILSRVAAIRWEVLTFVRMTA